MTPLNRYLVQFSAHSLDFVIEAEGFVIPESGLVQFYVGDETVGAAFQPASVQKESLTK